MEKENFSDKGIYYALEEMRKEKQRVEKEINFAISVNDRWEVTSLTSYITGINFCCKLLTKVLEA